MAEPDPDRVGTGDRRRRAVISAAAVGSVALVAAAAVVAPGLLSGSSHSSIRQPGGVAGGAPATAAPPSGSPPAVAGNELLADGDLVEASGRVVEVPGKPLRFCGPEEFDAVAWAPGHEPAPTWCPLGVAVTGVDLTKLSDYRTKAGATEGFAYLRGTWADGVLHVSVQTAPRYPALGIAAEISPAQCPEPASGWPAATNPNPSEALTKRIHAFQADHPDEVVTQAVARPTTRSSYWVVVVQHPEIATAALRPVAGQLCVLQSRYTKAQVAAALAPLVADEKAHLTDGAGTAAEAGESVGPDGQALVVTQVLMMTDRVQAWVASAPPGLLKVTPWLQPIGDDAPLPPLPSTATVGGQPTTASAAPATGAGG